MFGVAVTVVAVAAAVGAVAVANRMTAGRKLLGSDARPAQ